MEQLAAPVLSPRQALLHPLPRAAVARCLTNGPAYSGEVAEAPITRRHWRKASWQLTELAELRIENPTPLSTTCCAFTAKRWTTSSPVVLPQA